MLQEIKIICDVCGKEKYLPFSQRIHKYCSSSCYHKGQIGSKRKSQSEFMKNNKFRKGIKHTMQYRKKVSGKNSKKWNGGVTPLYHKIKRLPEYNQWRLFVYERDLFKCQNCGGLRLECHHIKSFSEIIRDNNIKTYKEAIKCSELWDIKNGITLCKECHKKTDSYGKNI